MKDTTKNRETEFSWWKRPFGIEAKVEIRYWLLIFKKRKMLKVKLYVILEGEKKMNKLPKKFQQSICEDCKFFWVFPVRNEHGEDWQWECNHPEEYGEEDSFQPKNYCQGYEQGQK